MNSPDEEEEEEEEEAAADAGGGLPAVSLTSMLGMSRVCMSW